MLAFLPRNKIKSWLSIIRFEIKRIFYVYNSQQNTNLWPQTIPQIIPVHLYSQITKYLMQWVLIREESTLFTNNKVAAANWIARRDCLEKYSPQLTSTKCWTQLKEFRIIVVCFKQWYQPRLPQPSKESFQYLYEMHLTRS